MPFVQFPLGTHIGGVSSPPVPPVGWVIVAPSGPTSATSGTASATSGAASATSGAASATSDVVPAACRVASAISTSPALGRFTSSNLSTSTGAQTISEGLLGDGPRSRFLTVYNLS
jgi:hypothetical protein